MLRRIVTFQSGPASAPAAKRYVGRHEMKLIRNIVAVLVGVAVSLVLMTVGGWILAQGPDTRVLIEQKERSDKGIEPTKNEIDQLLTSIERNHRYIRWGMGPMIVLSTMTLSRNRKQQ